MLFRLSRCANCFCLALIRSALTGLDKSYLPFALPSAVCRALIDSSRIEACLLMIRVSGDPPVSFSCFSHELRGRQGSAGSVEQSAVV